ncbi:MAG TPA: hypothetical protein VFQ75_10090 [Candidatus Limnocylindrales bacterium]|nr:hypothetical protein [Candidatus Limnocylindrales bacterium]
MQLTRHPRRTVIALAVAATLSLAACGSAATPTPSDAGGSAPAASVAAPSAEAPSLTPVPGGASTLPEPVPTRIGTTQTDWGEILDNLPASFPAYPNVEPADIPEVATAALSVPDDAATVAAWYRDAFTATGYGVELSDPAEDGSRVLDVQADLPECRIQMTFRPEDGSTIIAILVAAACANGTG